MTIKPISAHVYAVESSPNDKQTVDVRAFNFNGSCTCRAFKGCSRFVLRHQGEDESRESTQCDHIRSVHEFIMRYEYPALIERTEKIIELPTRETRSYDLSPISKP